MGYQYITDMSHLFSDDPRAEMPPKLLSFRSYLGHMIKAATVTSDFDFVSAIQCRKKVNRKPCPGFAHIITEEIPVSFIYWHCTHCEDGGRISNWLGCVFDQSEYGADPVEPTEENNPVVVVKISREEMSALLQDSLFDPGSERIIYSARPLNSIIILQAGYEEMENFEGFLAAETNHERRPKRQKILDALHDEVCASMDLAYEEFELGLD
jgi:hypothetical protein